MPDSCESFSKYLSVCGIEEDPKFVGSIFVSDNILVWVSIIKRCIIQINLVAGTQRIGLEIYSI